MTPLRAKPSARTSIAVRLARLVVLCTLGVAGSAAGAPHKILVLPVDGNADAATRTKLSSRINKLARTLDGQVATAETTFADTALAVGCDPQAPGCSDLVIATLGVDELIWGTATRNNGQTHLVVRRARKGLVPREVSTTIAAGDANEHTDAAIAPLFTPMAEPLHPGVPADGVAGRAGEDPLAPQAGTTGTGGSDRGTTGITADTADVPADRRDRNLGIGLTAGGGAAFVLGLALLASYSSLQGKIDDHPTENHDDFEDLRSLESKAARYAIAGDVLVVTGLAVGGVGAYYLYRHHKRQRVAVLPTPMGHGAGLTLTIVGAP